MMVPTLALATSLANVNHPAKTTKAKVEKTLAQHSLEHEQLVTIPMILKKKDCWKKRPIAMTQLAAKVFKINVTNPGAGIAVEEQKGYGTVTKDGFMEVACVKDYMYSHGDKEGPNKHEYEIGTSSNVSIVHYSMLVPKEDQQSMSAEVCFEFCRTVPDMLFFGLTAGRECYCEPYFKQMAGDSSKCDAVCEGEPTTFCGGMKKSSVFEMHFCDNTAGELASAEDKVSAFLDKAEPMAKEIQADADALQSAAEAGQAKFGTAGDTVMSDLMQTAKVFAGEIDKAVAPAVKLGEELGAAVEEAKGMDGADFTDPAEMKKAEELLKKMEEGLTEMEGMSEKVMDLHELARGSEYTDEGKLKEVEGEPLKQFHTTMYFVDREFESVPSTCGGEVLKKPMMALDVQECAAACSAEGIACSGFSYVTLKTEEVDKVCFLFSKMTSITYYTECKSALLFLQRPKTKATMIQKGNSTEEPEKAEDVSMCYAKFSSFVGTTLKPDPSGKCELCLKTADKAQRCYE
jgi:hypothetical protein